ncbi:unnamed protein product, partial [Clonostachys rosea]
FKKRGQDRRYPIGVVGQFNRLCTLLVTVLGDYLYIEGGSISTPTGGRTQVNETLSIPLKEGWASNAVQAKTIPHPDGMYSVDKHGTWAGPEGESLYRWGGDQGLNVPRGFSPELFMMQADGQGGGSWSTISPSNHDLFQGTKAGQDRASASCDGVGYFIGGISKSSTDFQDQIMSTPDLIRYNMSTREWRKETSHDLNPPNGGIQLAQAVCVPGFANHSLVMVLGGKDPIDKRGESAADRDLAAINFYDPHVQKWYPNQPTSFENEGPQAREQFCSVGVPSKNNTFEIFVFGGLRASDRYFYNDVWILSLPAFRWFRGPSDSSVRIAHRCAVVGKRQMISVGGLDGGTTHGFERNDTVMNGIRLLDMTDLVWRDSYDPSLDEYDSPDIIKEWYQSGYDI